MVGLLAGLLPIAMMAVCVAKSGRDPVRWQRSGVIHHECRRAAKCISSSVRLTLALSRAPR